MFQAQERFRTGAEEWSVGLLPDFTRTLDDYGLHLDQLATRIRIPRGTQAWLRPTKGSVLSPRMLSTKRPRQFKSWVGNPDSLALRMTSASPVPLPGAESAPYEHWSDLARAAWHYFFCNSSAVASYEPAIEQLGPFPVAVYAAREVVIERGASLVVSGLPTVLLFEHLTIEDGGTLQIFSVCKASVGTLVRSGGPSHLH